MPRPRFCSSRLILFLSLAALLASVQGLEVVDSIHREIEAHHDPILQMTSLIGKVVVGSHFEGSWEENSFSLLNEEAGTHLVILSALTAHGFTFEDMEGALLTWEYYLSLAKRFPDRMNSSRFDTTVRALQNGFITRRKSLEVFYPDQGPVPKCVFAIVEKQLVYSCL